jgi:hypothetical protein
MSYPKPAFSEAEEAFFRAGTLISLPEPPDTFADLDDGHRRTSMFRWLRGRKHANR